MGIKNWYPFYPTDFERDTMILSPEERGLYRDVLDIYWLCEGEVQDKNVTKMMQKRGYSCRKFAKLWIEVATFFPVEKGKLTNKRMDKELGRARARHKTAVANGRAGARAKAKQALEQTPEQGSSSPQQQSPSHTVIPPDGGNNSNAVVASPMGWVQHFMNHFGYEQRSAQTPKTIPMFQSWCDAEATVAEINQCMDSAKISLRGDMPSAPGYLDKIFRDLRGAESDQRNKPGIPVPISNADLAAETNAELFGTPAGDIVSEQ